MTASRSPLLAASMIGLSLVLAGCRRQEPQAPPAAAGTPAPTNRIDIPPMVRQNLGITFAKVESRPVSRTIRLPGRFDLMPDATREYRTMLAGRVEVLVAQYQRVDPGTPLYRLDSPQWRELREQLSAAIGASKRARASADSIGPLKAAHKVHEDSLRDSEQVIAERVAQIEQVRATVGGKADELSQARTQLASVRSQLGELMEKDAELDARELEAQATLEEADNRLTLLLSTAASISGVPRDQLVGEKSTAGPLFTQLDVIEVKASAHGVVDTIGLTPGAWAQSSSLVLTVVQPERVQFRARAMQSDLGRLSDGLAARIVPPSGGSLRDADELPGALMLAPLADAQRRTLDVIVRPTAIAAWAKAGVSGFVEVVIGGSLESQLAIPTACVVRDGTQSLIFRRDPRDPGKVIRMEADLGADDGRWIVIKSGVAEGNEVVRDGAYQLMVATSGSITKGGHFHPDGTFHEGND